MNWKAVIISVVVLFFLAGCTSPEEEFSSGEGFSSTPGGEVQDVPSQTKEYKIRDIFANIDQLNNQHVSVSGKIQETVSAGTYTYARLRDSTGEVWVAGPRTQLEEGAPLDIESATVIAGFNAPALNKTLDVILMTQSFGQGDSTFSPHGTTPSDQGSVPANISVEKLEGGHTVAEIYSQKEELSGQEVEVRAMATKVLPNIMNKTWIHLRDGTSEQDLVVTYTGNERIIKGDVLVARGKLQTDVDIGAGYFYPVLIDNAEIKKE